MFCLPDSNCALSLRMLIYPPHTGHSALAFFYAPLRYVQFRQAKFSENSEWHDWPWPSSVCYTEDLDQEEINGIQKESNNSHLKCCSSQALSSDFCLRDTGHCRHLFLLFLSWLLGDKEPFISVRTVCSVPRGLTPVLDPPPEWQ